MKCPPCDDEINGWTLPHVCCSALSIPPTPFVLQHSLNGDIQRHILSAILTVGPEMGFRDLIP